MRRPAPFASLLLSAAFASLSAIVLARWEAPASAREALPVVEASTGSYEAPMLSESQQAAVTESKPAISPADTGESGEDPGAMTASQVEDAVATPGVAANVATEGAALPQVAPPDPVATLQSGLVAPDAVEPQPGKETALFDLVNAARLAAGVAVLERSAELDAVAHARARNLIENEYFDHYSPDGSSAFSELAARNLPYRLAGENLARNNYPSARTVAAAFEGLMASPGHRANIMEPRFGAIGLAAVKHGGFWLYVMVFTNPR